MLLRPHLEKCFLFFLVALLVCPWRLTGCGEGSMTPDPGGDGPEVYRIEPPSGPPLSKVSVFGSNFESRADMNTVRFDETEARVLAVTLGETPEEPDEIEVEVPSGSPIGRYPVSVEVHGERSNPVPFEVTAPRAYQVGSYTYDMVTGDLNCDGVPDLVVSDRGRLPEDNGILSVLLGTGDGTFRDGVEYDAVTDPGSIAIGDLNGDNKPDLAVGNMGSGQEDEGGVFILLGNGDGTFSEAGRYEAGAGIYFVTMGDLNGDDKLDLALTVLGKGVSILIGNGDGTFQDSGSVLFQYGGLITVEDLNADGYLDLVCLGECEGWPGSSDPLCVSVLLGKGDGSFEYPVERKIEIGNMQWASGDFNGDGFPDLVMGSGDGVSVLLHNGDGTLLAPIPYYLFTPRDMLELWFKWVFVDDLNGDGVLDIIVATYVLGVSILMGNGDGTFQTPINIAVGALAMRIVIEDFNQDGFMDMAVLSMNGFLSVVMGRGDGTFQLVSYGAGDRPRSITIGDLDGDSALDMAVANYGSNDVSILKGNGDGTFQAAADYAAGEAPQGIAMGDLQGDGHPDLAVANYGSNDVSILMGIGDGTFLTATRYAVGDGPQAVVIGDLNNDDAPDMAVANYDSNDVSILLGKGDGTFLPAACSMIETNPTSVAIGDLDRDGIPDLAVTRIRFGLDSVGCIGILRGRGDGTFQEAVYYNAGGFADAVAIGDLNGDENPDLVVAHGDVSVLVGRGDGTFSGAVYFEAGGSAVAVAIGDVNGDGNPDLVVAGPGNVNASMLMGKGDGTFLPALYYLTGGFAYSISLGDLDGDGGLDVAVTNSDSNSVSILMVH